jgi:hypothetical protein
MHYYLADDAIEIRTKPQPGFDKVPIGREEGGTTDRTPRPPHGPTTDHDPH